jgi:hypothetical protein
MWLFDIEQDVLRVGCRVLIQDESEMSGRTGTICGQKCGGKWPVLLGVEGQSSLQHSFPPEHLREMVIDPQKPLPASNGLFIQPYCASVPMPPAVLSRCVVLEAA